MTHCKVLESKKACEYFTLLQLVFFLSIAIFQVFQLMLTILMYVSDFIFHFNTHNNVCFSCLFLVSILTVIFVLP